MALTQRTDLTNRLGIDGHPGGGQLLLADMRVASMLANHARHRAVARTFGVSRDQANLATLIAVLLVADKTSDRLTRMLRAQETPSMGEGLLFGASLRAGLGAIVGPPARDAPMFGILVSAAVLGTTLGPTVVKSIHGVTTYSHRMALGFHHRYGYVVDPGHWREQRARRRAARI